MVSSGRVATALLCQSGNTLERELDRAKLNKTEQVSVKVWMPDISLKSDGLYEVAIKEIDGSFIYKHGQKSVTAPLPTTKHGHG